MFFVYKPEGAAPKKWEFAPDRLLNPEAEAIERVTKMTFAEWADAVLRGSVTALHALLWVMLKRADPTLTYDAVQFMLCEVDLELSDEESAEALAELEGRVARGETLEPEAVTMLAKLRESAPAGVTPDRVPEEAGDPKEVPALVS